MQIIKSEKINNTDGSLAAMRNITHLFFYETELIMDIYYTN